MCYLEMHFIAEPTVLEHLCHTCEIVRRKIEESGGERNHL
jgi:hypothetical protein